MNKPDLPLTNIQRILILQQYESRSDRFLSDLERVHFNTNARSEMRPLMAPKVSNTDGAFDDVYDEYLLALWDELNAGSAPEVGGPGGDGSPIGLLFALTQQQEGLGTEGGIDIPQFSPMGFTLLLTHPEQVN